jgi:hypothetical protein
MEEEGGKGRRKRRLVKTKDLVRIDSEDDDVAVVEHEEPLVIESSDDSDAFEAPMPVKQQKSPVKKRKASVLKKNSIRSYLSSAAQVAASVKKAETKSDSATDSLMFVDKYAPKTEEDLCLHPKKKTEIKEAILNAVQKFEKRVIIVEGPSGCGKRTSVEVLCKVNRIPVLTWNPPSSSSDVWSEDKMSREVQYESQVDRFVDFVVRAQRYADLNFNSEAENHRTRSVVLIHESDMPSFTFNDASRRKLFSLLHFMLTKSKYVCFVFVF